MAEFRGSLQEYLDFPELYVEGRENICFNEELFKNEYKNNNITILLLNELFNRKTDFDNVKALRIQGNFIRYFSDHLFGNISFEEFDTYKTDKEFTAFRSFLATNIQQGKTGVVLDLLIRITKFNSKESLFNYTKGIMFFCNTLSDFSISGVCYNRIATHSVNQSFFPSDADFKTFIEDLLTPDSFPFLSEALVGGELLRVGKSTELRNIDPSAIKEKLLNCLNRFTDAVSVYDARCLLIHHNIIDKTDESKVAIDPRANDIVRKYILKYPKEFLTIGLILKHGPQFTLEAYIDEYLGWQQFEDLLNSVEEDFNILTLKLFYKFYKRNSYIPVSFDFNILSISSDSETRFIQSLDYPELTEQLSVINERPGKLSLSGKFPVFSYAKWIARSPKVTKDEAEKGGVYIFKRAFNLTRDAKKIKSAKIYFLVDDYLRIVVNNGEPSQEFAGYESVPHEFDMTKSIAPNGMNEIVFSVRNTTYERSEVEKFDDPNPYEFIYNLILEFE